MSGGTKASGVVERIWVASHGGAQMSEIEATEALEGRGLAHDRYGRGVGSFHDDCQVTFVEAEHLEAVAAATGFFVLAGEHRRNVVTRGLDHQTLIGRRFKVGDAVFEYNQDRLGCRYLERITQEGMIEALGERAGFCARVVVGAPIRVGDPVALED